MRGITLPSSKWMFVGLLGIIAACATVVGTPVALDDTNKRLLEGKWVGTFEARGAITGTVYTTRAVTFVIDGGPAGKGTYTTYTSDGALAWRAVDGKAIISVEHGKQVFRSGGQVSGERDDFVFTLSRGTDGSLYLQSSWDVTVRDYEGRTWPQIHSIILKK